MTPAAERQTNVFTCLPIRLDARSAAAALSVGRTLFYQLCASGRIGPLPVRLGERSLWVRAELESWATAGCPPRAVWLDQNRSHDIKNRG
jgi:predicted DNA-binding transcriptional regulator AlpA